ncbi:MAG TPA: phosphatase PAP2 family protein [Vicinamibacterales bacterium]|jgi:hypothetical protein|nr:phosphatase PAP2 family protein [Vicinamibacterales bacterium]
MIAEVAPAVRTRRGGWSFATWLLMTQVIIAMAIAPWYDRLGLHIVWRSTAPLGAAYGALAAIWLYGRYHSRHRKEILQDVVFATALMLSLGALLSPAQYVAVALKRPLIDAWLVRADGFVGINVGALAAWTAHHQLISLVLSACYATLLPQFLLPILVLAMWYGDRDGLWEYVFHYQFCLVLTVATLALYPAANPPDFMNFAPTIDLSRSYAQIHALRSGTFHTIEFAKLEGLVSMPSFHAAGAMMVVWAFRRHRRWWIPLAFVNTGLVAATFMSGIHYLVDVIGAAVMFGASLAVYQVMTARAAVTAPIATAPVTALPWTR